MTSCSSALLIVALLFGVTFGDHEAPLKEDNENQFKILENKIIEMQNTITNLEKKISEMEQCQQNNAQQDNNDFIDPFDIYNIRIKIAEQKDIILVQSSNDDTTHCPKWHSMNDDKVSLFCPNGDEDNDEYQWILKISNILYYDIKSRSILNTNQKWKSYSKKSSDDLFFKFQKDVNIKVDIIDKTDGLSLYLLEDSYWETFTFKSGANGNINMKQVIPKYAKAFRGHVLLTTNSADHFIFQIGSKICPSNQGSCALWHYKHNGKLDMNPSFNPKQVFLRHAGDKDKYSEHYGAWYTSLTIPLTDEGNSFWSVAGCNGGTIGTALILIDGYYA